MTNKEEQIQFAKFAEQTERYNDMVVAMRSVVKSNNELSNEERNLLSIAYKNVISVSRSTWRIMSNIEKESECTGNKRAMAKQYREKIESELKDTCQEILTATETESKVFYLKMKGDYYRYLAEIATGNEQLTITEESYNAYMEAFDIAKNQMPASHPIRLGVALNFSVFHYEIRSAPDVACRLAKQAFDDALLEIDSIDERTYRESIVIIQLLRDNLTLWSNEESDINNINQSEKYE